MARYNTAPQTITLTGATTFTYAFTGGIISLTGTSGYTVTLVSPVFFPGSKQTFYNATTGNITLTTAAGTIRGNGVTIGPSVIIPTNSTYVLTSDGESYVLTSGLAGSTVFELPVTTNGSFTAQGAVNLTPNNANVTISPTGSGTVAISPAGLLSIQPGGNVTIQPTGTSTLTLNTSGGTLTVGSASVPTNIGGNLSAVGSGRAITLSPASTGTVTISPGGNATLSSGAVLAISSSTLGTINNMSIGATTRAAGAFTTLAANNAVTMTANTASTSTTSGTLVVTGGLGVSGAIYAGSIQATPIGATTRSTGAFTSLTSNAATTFTQNTASTSTTTGTLVVTGGVGVSGAIYAGSLQNTAIGSATRNTGAFTTLTANSTTTVTATTGSTSTTTGAFQVSGGVGIAERLYAGSIQNTPIGSVTANTAAFTTLTTSSTTTLSPASANVAISPTGTGTVTISPAGALTLNPSTAGTINNMSIGATTRSTGAFTTLTANNTVTFTQNTGATSTTTGTLRVTGGVGISERLYAGSIQASPIGSVTRSTGAFTSLTSNAATTFTQNTASTSTATGTLVVTGGVGVSGSVWAANINSTGGSTGIIGYTPQNVGATLADIDRKYIVSNTSAITLTLPLTSTDGRTIIIVDGNNFGSFNVIIGRNTRTIAGAALDLTLNVPNSRVELVYRGGDWKVFAS